MVIRSFLVPIQVFLLDNSRTRFGFQYELANDYFVSSFYLYSAVIDEFVDAIHCFRDSLRFIIQQ